jgi:signal transduction histidine kinase
LKVIASSPDDVQPVLEAVAERAMSLLDAWSVLVTRFDGELLRFGAARGALPDTEQFLRNYYPMRPEAAVFAGRCILERIAINISDAQADPSPQNRERARLRGFRAALSVPMLRDGQPIGVITVSRSEAGAFAANEVALLQTFADQAVIAIENVRLFNETKEALERQTATSDILRVIAGSPSDVQPVFEAILSRALHLCEAAFGFLTTYDGERFAFAAQLGVPPALAEHFDAGMDQPRPGDAHWRLVNGENLIHNPDQKDEEAYRAGNPLRRAVVDIGGARSALVVALRKSGSLCGSITIYRKEVRPFSESQIALLRHFADQAVIAIENARLFAEVQAKTADLYESLQQQTATADVLKVISRSAFDLQTVLNTLVTSAATLCEAERGLIFLRQENYFGMAANYGFSPELEAFARANPLPADGSSTTARAAASGVAVQAVDVLADETQGEMALQYQRLGGHRTNLGVPLGRKGEIIGVFTLTRQVVRPFTDKQIELVSTFADQAVIAIQNARMFDEVQAKTRELSQSLDDLRAAQDRLIQTEKLASLGQLTAGIAHEIKNPLNFVNNFSALSAELVEELDETLAPAPLDPKMRGDVGELTQILKSNLEKVVQHGKRADSIVKNMLQHSREGSGEHRPVDINTIVDESLNLAYHGARAENAGFSTVLQRDLDPSVGMAEVYPQELTRVLLNIISNGFYAVTKRKAEAGEGFEPTLAAVTKNLGDKIEIRIRDNGTGIPDEVKEKIFNPFFTTKPSGEGTGLGLSMSHDIIVKQHGGSIDVESEPGLFTEFKIVLPRTSQR